jgi:hypothetical protein
MPVNPMRNLPNKFIHPKPKPMDYNLVFDGEVRDRMRVAKELIWSAFSRNDVPLKISWCFPKKVFSLVSLEVLIIYANELGSVSFIKS